MTSEPSKVRRHQGAKVITKRSSQKKKWRSKLKVSLQDEHREKIAVGGEKCLGELQHESENDGFIPFVFHRKIPTQERKESQNQSSSVQSNTLIEGASKCPSVVVVHSESHAFDDNRAGKTKSTLPTFGSNSLNPPNETQLEQAKECSISTMPSFANPQSSSKGIMEDISVVRKESGGEICQREKSTSSLFNAQEVQHQDQASSSSTGMAGPSVKFSAVAGKSNRNQYRAAKVVRWSSPVVGDSANKEQSEIAVGGREVKQKRMMMNSGASTSTTDQSDSRTRHATAQKRKRSTNVDESNVSSSKKRARRDNNTPTVVVSSM